MSEARIIRRLGRKKAKKMGDKRWIKVPEDILLFELDGKTRIEDKNTGKQAKIPFELFLLGRTIDPAFAGADPGAEPPRPPVWNMSANISGEAVRAAFRDKEPGTWVGIHEDDYERLKRGTEKGSYEPRLAGMLVPFMRVICDAKLERPKEEKELSHSSTAGGAAPLGGDTTEK